MLWAVEASSFKDGGYKGEMLFPFEIKRTDKGHWEEKVACSNCTRSSA
jgi:hypothetical protein